MLSGGYQAMESGMMSYSESRSGLVLTFAMGGWDPATHDAFLTLDWEAEVSPNTPPCCFEQRNPRPSLL